MSKSSALWSICGIEEEKHLLDGTVILYDITRSYFKGEYQDSEIVAFSGIESKIITEIDKEQEEIAKLLGVKY